jgi:RNA 2',3'-cyclic 3'-phosphodiesterase
MRLFVAISPPAGVLDELDARVAPLRPGWPQLRWTSREAWHLTLAFLGEVGDQPAAALHERLQRAAHRHPSLALWFEGVGAFSAPSRARVLWTGIHGDVAPLTALAASVAAGARRAGAPPPDEGRRYRPHLTLARCREPEDLRPLVDTLGGFAGSPWTATEINLVRSNLQGEPRYQALGSWRLREP